GSENLGKVATDIEILPSVVTDSNLQNPDPVHLIPTGASSIATTAVEDITIGQNSTIVREGSFLFAGADPWTLKRPALYVVGIYVSVDGVVVDTFYDSFGLRRIQVDPTAPRLLLDGDPIAFTGVAVHYEKVSPPVNGAPHGSVPPTPANELQIVRNAQS